MEKTRKWTTIMRGLALILSLVMVVTSCDLIPLRVMASGASRSTQS